MMNTEGFADKNDKSEDLPDHKFRKLLYESLKGKIIEIEADFHNKHSEKIRKIELQNYKRFEECIAPLKSNDNQQFQTCQFEFAQNNILTFIKQNFESTKKKPVSLYKRQL